MTNQERINLVNLHLDTLHDAERSLVRMGIGYAHRQVLSLDSLIKTLQAKQSSGKQYISLNGIATVLVDDTDVVMATEPQM